MSFKRGLSPSTPTAGAHAAPSQANIRGRIFDTREPEPAPRARVIARDEPERAPPVRGLLVGTDGRMLKGLSQATVAAHQAHTENASELCTNCGEQRTPSQMKTIIANAYNSNNPLRICQDCAKLAYKNPHDESQKWRPAVPQVRFDRDRGKPYDAQAAGVTLKDLVTKDTYHRERDVAPELRGEHAPSEGVWSGGGRAGHAISDESLEASRERAARRR